MVLMLKQDEGCVRRLLRATHYTGEGGAIPIRELSPACGASCAVQCVGQAPLQG